MIMLSGGNAMKTKTFNVVYIINGIDEHSMVVEAYDYDSAKYACIKAFELQGINDVKILLVNCCW